VRGYKGKNGRHGRRAAKEAGRTGRMGRMEETDAWGPLRAAAAAGQGFAASALVGGDRRWCCMLDGPGSAGQPGWANRLSLPLQQTGATRTIVSNPRPSCSRLLCAYPYTPARQTLRHRPTLQHRCSPARESAPLSARRPASGAANLTPSLLARQLRVQRCPEWPSVCIQRVAHPSPIRCQYCLPANQEPVRPPPLDQSPLFHTPFDHAQSGLIDR
jgi:hypothetical protein